ncbi:hypothetical protein [Flavobacterium sp. MDT1-60]|uniref:hypothetical protein n=1 Tax=Flavobacterium sp. MDT1-60 TaxID=1979344 RepID=UPI00177F5F5D|nr:hypothetical protein [Flavobacterium sp. MDT1-60]QOG02108.1 hypothetical protein IHE43_20270 [Flavobacterium sp. MDT1-60]
MQIEVDHFSIEKELNDYFEKNFSKNTQIIRQFVNNKEFTEDVNSTLTYFAKYGIIGDMRTPRFKKETDNALEEVFTDFFSHPTPELKTQTLDATKPTLIVLLNFYKLKL